MQGCNPSARRWPGSGGSALMWTPEPPGSSLIEPGPVRDKSPYAGSRRRSGRSDGEGPEFAICPLWHSGVVENRREKRGETSLYVGKGTPYIRRGR